MVAVAIGALHSTAGAAVTSNGEYVVGSIPFAPTTDVAFGGTSVFAGAGTFGVGSQTIARVDADGSVTTLVTNLNSIGGLVYDVEGDRLLFTDNGLDAAPGGATTGDTVYAFPTPLSADGSEFLVGDVDSVTFAGSVERFDLAGEFLGTLAAGLSGTFDQTLDRDGRLLVTGGFTGDFSSSTVVRLDGALPVEQVASGFGFTAGIDVDRPSGMVAVIDFGAAQIDTLTPIENMTPGGRGKKECHTELFGQDPDRSKSGRPRNRWTCEDGDPECDRDYAVDGKCTPGVVDTAEVALRPKVAGSDSFPELLAAVDAVLPAASASCSALVPLEVAADGKKKILVTSYVGSAKLDRDRVTLKCKAP